MLHLGGCVAGGVGGCPPPADCWVGLPLCVFFLPTWSLLLVYLGCGSRVLNSFRWVLSSVDRCQWAPFPVPGVILHGTATSQRREREARAPATTSNGGSRSGTPPLRQAYEAVARLVTFEGGGTGKSTERGARLAADAHTGQASARDAATRRNARHGEGEERQHHFADRRTAAQMESAV